MKDSSLTQGTRATVRQDLKAQPPGETVLHFIHTDQTSEVPSHSAGLQAELQRKAGETTEIEWYVISASPHPSVFQVFICT